MCVHFSLLPSIFAHFTIIIATPNRHLKFSAWLQVLLVTSSLYVGLWVRIDFPGISVVKNPSTNAGDTSSIPVSRRSPGRGNSNPLQYSLMESPWTKEPGGCSPWGRKESGTLSD